MVFGFDYFSDINVFDESEGEVCKFIIYVQLSVYIKVNIVFCYYWK